jgi:hypothetical protein
MIRQLLAELPRTEEELRTVLDQHSARVVITKEEDAALTAAGVQSSIPEPG